MKVEFKRNIMKNPGRYVHQLNPGLYEDDGDQGRYFLVAFDHHTKKKYAIRLDTLYPYQNEDWLGAVIPIGTGNQIILTSEGTEHVSATKTV